MSRADFDQEEETMALAIVLISLVCIGSNCLTKNSRVSVQRTAGEEQSMDYVGVQIQHPLYGQLVVIGLL